jgi:hemerythrin superfamily protein
VAGRGDRDRRHVYATIQFFNQQGKTVMTMTTTTRKDEIEEEQDAIEMLIADHKTVKKLFVNFEVHKDDGDDEDKSAIVKLICNELKVHATLEEEIFYPAVRKAIQDSALMDEALVEHAGAKDLIAQLEEADPEDDLYDAKVTVLGEQIDHHVKEEEGAMFPKAKKAKLDTAALGAQMLKRKAALMAEMGMDKEGSDETRPSGQKKKTGTR